METKYCKHKKDDCAILAQSSFEENVVIVGLLNILRKERKVFLEGIKVAKPGRVESCILISVCLPQLDYNIKDVG